MPKETEHFSLEKVRALKAYFMRMRNSSRGRPEYADIDTSLKLCDQVIALMSPARPEKSAGGKP